MAIVTVRELLEAGVHFGHQVSRKNPKMEPYIYGKRNLIHIIDLRSTIRGMLQAVHFLRRLSANGEQILFVGTKRQAKNVVREEAKRCRMHYVCERWLGGTLTNYSTIRSRLSRLEELEKMEADGSIDLYSKKMQASLQREKRKIKRNLEGIRRMVKLPDCMLIVDPRREINAVREARKLEKPIIAVLDTDCDPSLVDISIPANDDSMRSIQVILARLTDAIVEGRSEFESTRAAEAKVEPPVVEAPPPPAPVAAAPAAPAAPTTVASSAPPKKDTAAYKYEAGLPTPSQQRQQLNTKSSWSSDEPEDEE